MTKYEQKLKKEEDEKFLVNKDNLVNDFKEENNKMLLMKR
jgi:hypothetical protein